MERLLTPKEVCAALGMTAKTAPITLMRWRLEGRIRGVKVGKAVRFRESDVEAFIKKQAKA